MTQEIIDKLHELEAKRGVWVKFKDALTRGKNIAIEDYSHTPAGRMAVINYNNIEDWESFQTYIMKFVDTKINMRDSCKTS